MRSTVTVFGVIAVACLGCESSHTVTSQGPRTTASAAATTESSSTAPPGGLFAEAEPWTVDVSAAEKSSRSDAIIQTLSESGGWGNGNALQVDFSIPIFYADADTARMEVVGTQDYCFGGNACDSVPAQMPVPDGAHIEGSADLSCDPSGQTDGQGDCHLLVVDRDGAKLYETYQANRSGEALETNGFFVWDLAKDYPDNLRGDQCTSADAAGFPIAAMTPTADEVASGAVDHALRFVLPNDRMKADVYVAPATHAGGPESAQADAPPYGVRFRLRPDFDESSYNDAEKVILEALKTHGMLLSDGGDIALTFADDANNTAKWSDLGVDAQSFSGIGVDQFEVVELGEEIPLTYDCVRNS
jgi:hypothetical protein